MSISNLHDWSTALAMLREAAMQGRGFVAIDDDGQLVPDHPRTSGNDAISIAAVLDPIVRETLFDDGDPSAFLTWALAVDDLARDALVQPLREYIHNAAYWSALADVAIELDERAAALPPLALWSALVDALAEPTDFRNVDPKGDGPFKHFDGVKTFDDLYNAQAKHLRELRGFDKLDPEPGGSGGVRSIPRSTNADVIQLADYWTKRLGSIKHVMGHDAVVKRWTTALADVNAIARTGNPDAVYSKNNAFWRALQATAIQIAVADEAPSSWDVALAALKDSVKQLPENIATGAKAVASATTDVVGDIAKGAGRVANAAASGLFSGFGTPLLIGAGLVGLFLITQSKSSKEAV